MEIRGFTTSLVPYYPSDESSVPDHTPDLGEPVGRTIHRTGHKRKTPPPRQPVSWSPHSLGFSFTGRASQYIDGFAAGGCSSNWMTYLDEFPQGTKHQCRKTDPRQELQQPKQEATITAFLAATSQTSL